MPKFHSLLGSKLVRDVLKVASGTAAAQIVALAFAPFLTRLYGPEVFGLQGAFVALLAIMSTAAALSYPTAIVLPERDSDAKGLALLAILLGLFIAIILSFVIYFAGPQLLYIVGFHILEPYLYLIAIAAFLSVPTNVLAQWLVRKKLFGFIASAAILSALILGTCKVLVGILYPTAMNLILINVFGSAVLTFAFYLFYLYSKISADQVGEANINCKIFKLAVKFKDFPLLRAPQNVINAASHALPTIMLASVFGTQAAGFYAIALALIGAPSTLISNAVMTVFYPRVTESIRNQDNSRLLIIRATMMMGIVGSVPFAIVVLFGPEICVIVFGAQWEKAGVYAQLLSPWLFLQYLNKPAVAAIPALGIQGGLLVYELFSTCSKIIALYAAYKISSSDIWSIAAFSVTGCMAYIWLIIWVVFKSKT